MCATDYCFYTSLNPKKTELTMKSRSLFKLFSLSILFLLACRGPEGPAGRDALVEIFTDTIEIRADDFTPEDQFVSVAPYSWTLLDEATVDEGVVLGYLRFQGTTAWHPLPLTVPFENDVVILRYNFDIDSFNLILEGEAADNNAANANLFDGDILRIVAIPPDRVLKAKVNYADYSEVAALYGLPE